MNYRNRKLLDTARGMSCMGCGREDDTIVPAHANGAEFGKGAGIKAHDCFFAWLCHTCHTRLDHGKDMNREEKRDFFIRAMHKTWLQLWQSGRIAIK